MQAVHEQVRVAVDEEIEVYSLTSQQNQALEVTFLFNQSCGLQ